MLPAMSAKGIMPTQAIMRDRETWFSQGDESLTLNAEEVKKEAKWGALEVVFKILEMFGRG